jgi:hypothetical protein
MEFIFKNISEHYKPQTRKLPAWVNIRNGLITVAVAALATLANNFESVWTFISTFFK